MFSVFLVILTLIRYYLKLQRCKFKCKYLLLSTWNDYDNDNNNDNNNSYTNLHGNIETIETYGKMAYIY